MGRIIITLHILSLLGMLSGGYLLGHQDAWTSQQARTQVMITGSVG